MRYPTLTPGQVGEIVAALRAGMDVSADAAAVWRGEAESEGIDFDAFDEVLRMLQKDFDLIGADPNLTVDKEPFEGQVAVLVFPFLDALPIEVLDDPGFWRYLAVSRFWWFIRWREADAIERGNVVTYTDGRRNTEHIPLRLYLRVKAVAAAGEPELAKELKKCTDFWRSHVIRVNTATAPQVSAAFANMQRGGSRLPTKKLRAYARRLNRVWSNVQLGLYDRAQAEALISELRE